MSLDESTNALKGPANATYTCLPLTWTPFLELARLHKPFPILIAFFPYLFGILLAAPTADPVVSPVRLLTVGSLAFVHSIIIRGIGCTWNDFLDREIDGKVSRTRLRPLACRAISVHGALLFLGLQVLLELGILQVFPARHHYYIAPLVILIGVYPFAKRVTNYSPAILGIIAAWGVVLAFPALGLEIQSSNWAAISSLLIFSVAWAIRLDFVYAHQDLEDDSKLGIGSMAVRHRKHAKAILAGLAVIQMACLWSIGDVLETRTMYFVGVFGFFVSVSSQKFILDLRNPQRCAWWFKHEIWMTGTGVTAGLFTEYVQRLSAA